MKETIIVLIVLALVFIPGYIFKKHFDESGNELIKILEDMENDINNDYEVSEVKSNKLRDTFLNTEKKWIILVDHEILDQIEDDVEACAIYYKESEKDEFLVHSKHLRNHIEDLARREEISIYNIF